MNLFNHFRKHKIPHPNCIAYADGHTEHFAPDTTAQLTNPPAVNPTSLFGSQTGKPITWSLVNNSGDIPDHEIEAMAFALGITQWGLRLNVPFQRVRQGQQAAIPIEFISPSDSRYPQLFSSDNTLAVTYYPLPANGSYAGHMFFNDDFRVIWSLGGKPMPCSDALASGHATGCTDPNEMLQTLKLTRVGRHEFGHALGMQHFNASPNDTMYWLYNNTDKLGDDEVALAQTVYGKRTMLQSYIDSVDNIVAMES